MSSRTVLAWDSSTPWTSIALARFEGGTYEVLADFKEKGLSQSQALAPKVAEILAAAGCKPADLDLVAVGRGPGSFTGLRTGLALAKGLALGGKLALLGFSTLEILAHQFFYSDPQSPLVAPVIDARHQEFFTALYYRDPQSGLVSTLLEAAPLSPELLSGALREAARAAGRPDVKIKMLGPALPQIAALLSDDFIHTGEDTPPDAVALARLAFAQMGLPETNHPATAFYVRKPDIRVVPQACRA